jgi:membrane-bound ClpP family serine protease
MSNDSASEIIIDNNIKKIKKITNKVFVFNDLFTPIFIIITIVILIIGVIGLKFLDVLFAGSKYLTAIKLFGISIIVNIVILIFIIMSFSKIKFQRGNKGPTGNKGDKGDKGRAGGLQVCGETYETVQEKKAFQRSLNYLDLKPPFINND